MKPVKGRALYLGAVSNVKRSSDHVNIDVQFSQKKVSVRANAMVDSGATGIFIDKDFCRHHGITTVKRNRPTRLILFDGSKADLITHQVRGRITVNGIDQDLVFEVTRLSTYPIVLGLPWLKEFNPTINWKEEEILFAGAVDPGQSLEEQIPEELHAYLKVFSEEEAKVLPPHRSWDCAIDLMPDKPFRKGKVYGLSPAELEAQDQWIREHLEKGYIRPSKSPMSTSTFFVKKKDESGKMNNI